jgi:hypothetical protein
MQSLGTLGGANSTALDIDDLSEAMGGSQIRAGSEVFRAFLWSEARGMRGLGTLEGGTSVANAINNGREW